MISVCIFCFLCATHSPCASHAQLAHQSAHSGSHPEPYRERLKGPEDLGAIGAKANESLIDNSNSSGSTLYSPTSDSSSSVSNKKEDRRGAALKRLFSLYGDGEKMSFEDFQKFVARLDLLQESGEDRMQLGKDELEGDLVSAANQCKHFNLLAEFYLAANNFRSGLITDLCIQITAMIRCS